MTIPLTEDTGGNLENNSEIASTRPTADAPREIKFRAWDIRNEVMWMRKPKQLLSEFMQLIEQDTIKGGEQFVLMQYTGLKDRNGIEIYEGDIVRETGVGTDSYVSEIVFDNAAFWIKPTNGRLLLIHDQLEVIGNIYQNGDLL